MKTYDYILTIIKNTLIKFATKKIIFTIKQLILKVANLFLFLNFFDMKL